MEITNVESGSTDMIDVEQANIKRLYYSISEVSKLVDEEQYVLRYWESEFEQLRPQKNRAGNRIYSDSDIEVIRAIQHLLRIKRHTIDGAKEHLNAMNFGTADETPTDPEAQTKSDSISNLNEQTAHNDSAHNFVHNAVHNAVQNALPNSVHSDFGNGVTLKQDDVSDTEQVNTTLAAYSPQVGTAQSEAQSPLHTSASGAPNRLNLPISSPAAPPDGEDASAQMTNQAASLVESRLESDTPSNFDTSTKEIDSEDLYSNALYSNTMESGDALEVDMHLPELAEDTATVHEMNTPEMSIAEAEISQTQVLQTQVLHVDSALTNSLQTSIHEASEPLSAKKSLFTKAELVTLRDTLRQIQALLQSGNTAVSASTGEMSAPESL